MNLSIPDLFASNDAAVLPLVVESNKALLYYLSVITFGNGEQECPSLPPLGQFPGANARVVNLKEVRPGDALGQNPGRRSWTRARPGMRWDSFL